MNGNVPSHIATSEPTVTAGVAHDPLTRQLPDEPRFVLLARDTTAAEIVRLWTALRKQDNSLVDAIVKRLKMLAAALPYQPNKTPQHILSAQQVANSMDLWLVEQRYGRDNGVRE